MLLVSYLFHVLGNNFSPGAKPTSAGKSPEVQVPSTPWRPVGALTGRRGPQGRAQFSPTDGSCACHLEVNLNTIWSYWPRNFQPMYLMDRSSTFRRVWGRFGGSGALLSPSLGSTSGTRSGLTSGAAKEAMTFAPTIDVIIAAPTIYRQFVGRLLANQ